jgi:hypothetical protein
VLTHRTQPAGRAGRAGVVGEVRNNATTLRRFVQVTATCYDGANAVSGTGSSFAGGSEGIPTGETRPVSLSGQVPAQPASHKLDVTGQR